MSTPPRLIGPEQAALIGRPVSIIVASRDAAHTPHLMRAIGCRLRDDLGELTVFMPKSSGQPVLDDLRANGLIAVVFSEPTTERTVQLKGSDARVQPLQPGDAERARAYVQGFIEEIGRLGFPNQVAHTMFNRELDNLVAVSFTPSAAFEQTPGPQAGQALHA